MAAAGSCELLRQLVAVRPQLLERPYRPLGTTGLRFGERTHKVVDHYATLNRLIPAQTCRGIYLHGGCEAMLVDDRYLLRLGDAGNNVREGELAFYWIDTQSGTCLSQLSFYVGRGAHGAELFVGGLQGPGGADSLERIREATRACDGLRPKDVVLEALLAFAQTLSARRIVAVSRHNHVGRQRYTPRSIHADYDGFWMEASGTVLPCGNVEIPVAQPRRDLSEIPSKKRSAYRRKMARVDAVQAAVQQWLAPVEIAVAARTAGVATPRLTLVV